MPIVRNAVWLLLGVCVGEMLCLAGAGPIAVITSEAVSLASLAVFVMLVGSSCESLPAVAATR